MSDTFRAMCAELHTAIQLYTGQNPAAANVPPAELVCRLMDAMAASAALLAQPEPEGLTDAALIDLADELLDWNREGILTCLRAAIAADRARRPTPQPPADGEVAELQRWGVNHGAQPGRPLLSPMEDGYWTPWHIAADLLQSLASPACYVLDPSPKALASLKAAGPGIIEAMPAERMWPMPVAVSERPWEREGWCDDEGRCWWTANKPVPLPPSWWMVSIPQSCTDGIMLPFNALPLPQGHGI